MHIPWHDLWHARNRHIATSEKKAQVQSDSERLWTRDFAIIASVNFVIFLAANMLVSTVPFFIVDLGGSEVVVGAAAALYSLVALLTRPVAGWLLDHRSRKIVFVIGVTGMIIVPAAYLVLPVLSIVIFLRGVQGLVWASTTTASNTNACDIMPRQRFAEGMGFFGLTGSIAIVIGPALGLYLWEEFGKAPVFLSVSILCLLSLFMLRGFHFRKVQRSSNAANLPLGTRLAQLFDANALPAAVLQFVLRIPSGAISSFVALYAVQTGVGNGGLYFTFQALGTASTRVFAGKICDRRGEGLSIYSGCTSFAVGILIMVFAKSVFLFYFGSFLIGIAYGMTIPAMQTMSVRNVPTERRGAASSTYLCSIDIGFGIGGLLGGVFADLWGYATMFCILALGPVLCMVIYGLWASKTPAAFNYQKRLREQVEKH